ncbi:oxamate carbamoyltransferase subunit AllH family protein [Streptomyces sp. NPDC055085]
MTTALVSTAVAPLLAGPPRTGRVVAVTRHALYVATGVPALPALAVVTPDAVAVPCALVTAEAAGPPAGVRAGTVACFGAGRLTAGALRVTAGRSWTPPRVQGLLHDGVCTAPFGKLVDATALPLLPDVARRAAEFAAALVTDDSSRLRAAALALLGAGPGLTPSGDDVLCGTLLACHALGRPVPGPLMAAAALAEERTPLVSAALVLHAIRGECVPQAAALLRVLAAGHDAAPALRGLLAVGHHSGSDLSRGLALGLGAFTVRGTRSRPSHR